MKLQTDSSDVAKRACRRVAQGAAALCGALSRSSRRAGACLAILLLLPAAAVQAKDYCFTNNTVNVAPPAIPDFTGAEDHFEVGEQIGSLIAIGNKRPTILCEAYGSLTVTEARASPLLSNSTGLIWKNQGKDFPVYDSGAPGVGYAIAIRTSASGSEGAGEWMPLAPPYTDFLAAPLRNLYIDLNIWYIATGGLKPGSYNLPSTKIMSLFIEQSDGVTNEAFPVYLDASSFTIASQGCTLQTNKLQVDLGRRVNLDFKGVGSTSQAVYFPLSLQCPGSLQVSLEVNAGNVLDAERGLIGLTPSAQSAGGLGVQILAADGVTPIVLGQERQVLISSQGSNRIDLAARYYQTEEPVKAGSANGIATFILRYR